MDGFYLKGCPIHDPAVTDTPQGPWTDDDGMDP